VLSLAAGDHRLDPARPELTAVLVVVIAAVGEQPLGASARPADLADRLHTVDQRQQLGDVVAMRAGHRHRQRHPVRVSQQMVLGGGAGTIDRGRAGQAPPARRAHSRRRSPPATSRPPAAFNRRRSSRCRREKTPARCHSCRRRCAVAGEQPSSQGRWRASDPREEHEHDRAERHPIVHTRAATARVRLVLWQQRLDHPPQLIADLPHRPSHGDLPLRLCQRTGIRQPSQNPPARGSETASKRLIHGWQRGARGCVMFVAPAPVRGGGSKSFRHSPRRVPRRVPDEPRCCEGNSRPTHPDPVVPGRGEHDRSNPSDQRSGKVRMSLLAVSSWGPSAARAAALAVWRPALRELGLRRR
jgi:hypothetical protein